MNSFSSLFLRSAVRKRFGIYCSNRQCWTSIDFRNSKGNMREEDEPDVPLWESINGFRDLRKHTKMYVNEWVEKVRDTSRRVFPPEHEDVVMEFSFKDPATFKKFQVSADSEHQMGFSKAYLDMTKAGTALFHGYLDNTVPKDGRVGRTGFAAIRSYRKFKAFFRMDSFAQWQHFTHLLMKVRGDGRIYVITLGCPGSMDFEMADVFVYPLYTHGGPYWQFVTIPFSKFILTCNGRIPERGQGPVIEYKDVVSPNHRISSVGVTLMDRIDGPFQLEIDWVGVYKDQTNFEEWAYESYKTPIPV